MGTGDAIISLTRQSNIHLVLTLAPVEGGGEGGGGGGGGGVGEPCVRREVLKAFSWPGTYEGGGGDLGH